MLRNEIPPGVADNYWKEGNEKRAQRCRKRDVLLSGASSKLRPFQGMGPDDHLPDSSDDDALTFHREERKQSRRAVTDLPQPGKVQTIL